MKIRYQGSLDEFFNKLGLPRGSEKEIKNGQEINTR